MIPRTTDRLVLRRLTLDDAPFILELLNTPGFLRFVGDRGVRTVEEARRFLAERYLPSYETNGDVDLGFALLPRFEGNGYAGEAAAAALAEARETHGLARLAAITDPANAGSIRVLQRLGFRLDGRIVLGGEELCYFLLEL